MNSEYKVGGKKDEVGGKPIFWNEESAYARTWNDMQLHPLLKENLIAAKYLHPIYGQEYAIKPLIAHHNGTGIRQDARIKSLTGTGKTLIFLISIIQSLFMKVSNYDDVESISQSLADSTIAKGEAGYKKTVKRETTARSQRTKNFPRLRQVFKKMLNDPYRRKPNALILVPTRELAIQIKKEADKLLLGTNFKCAALYSNPQHKRCKRGKRTYLKKYADSKADAEQAYEIRDGANIVVATLGQLCLFIENRVFDLRHLDFFVVDEADQILMPQKDNRPRKMSRKKAFRQLPYFGALSQLTQVEKNALEEFKVKFSFENELVAIMYESNLIHFADGELKFRNRPKTQVIVTSAHIDPCELTKNYRQLLNRATETNKPDRVALFENRFMRKDSIRQRITHVFRLAAPYDELAPGSKSKFIKEPRRHIVEDKVKNNFLVGLMRKAIIEKISVLSFIERVPDVENHYEKMVQLEPDFNPNYKTHSVVAKISSLQTQEQREQALDRFHSKEVLLLITSNVCSRGLDLCATRVDVVVNYTLPEWTDQKSFKGYGRQENDYIYRVGRMARAGDVNINRKLLAVSFYSAPKNPKDCPVSSSQHMAQFIRNEIFQVRHADNTPEDEDAYDVIMADAEKYPKIN